MNNVSLAGRLGSDPESRDLTTGGIMVTLSLAVRDPRKVDGEWQDGTLWLKIKMFGTNAENALKVLRKGDGVAIDARLSKRTWKTEEGEDRAVMDIIANRWDKLGESRTGGGSGRAEVASEYDF